MAAQALLFNYGYCSGCHSCELACRNHLGLGLGEWGIKVVEVKPFNLPDDSKKVEWIYQPIPTQLCNLCANRLAQGEDPACVHHCQSFCIEYGSLQDMMHRAEEIGSRVSVYLR